MSKARQQKRSGYPWAQPKRLVSVRVQSDESRMAKRLSAKLGISQNRVFVEALRRLYSSVCSDAE